MSRVLTAALTLTMALLLPACSVVKDFEGAMRNLSRCKFKLDTVRDLQLAGVALSGKSSLGLAGGAAILAAYSAGSIPATFTLDVAAINPNDGSGGGSPATATLTSFAWTLILDSVTTVQGDIASPVTIPGTGQQTSIPLSVSLDMMKFFKEQGYRHIIELGLALSGEKGSTSRLQLRARPTISTPFGPITYPGEIEIVDKEFRG